MATKSPPQQGQFKAIYRHLDSIKGKVKKIKNKIIKGTIHDNFGFFDEKLKNILKEKYIFSDEKVKHAFYDICLDSKSYTGNENPMKMITKYIFERTNNIQNNKEDSAELSQVVVDLFTKSLQVDEAIICEYVLNWVVEDISKMAKIKPLIADWFNGILSECVENENIEALNRMLDGLGGQQTIKNNKKNTPAMIRACEKNNYEMILAFFYFGFTVDDTHFKEDKIDRRASSVMWLEHKPQDNDQLEKFKLFCATSEPAYLLANFKVKEKCEDPVSEAFLNSHISLIHQLEIPEYRNKYNDILRKSQRFVVSMLDLCRSTEEAVLFLSYDPYMEKYASGKNKSRIYPKLNLAVEEHHRHFATHDYCQQVLRNRWHQSDLTQEIIPWQSYWKYQKFIYYARTLFLLPIYMLFYLLSIPFNRGGDLEHDPENLHNSFDKVDLENSSKCRRLKNHLFNFFTYPFNRQQADMFIYIIFLGCFAITLRNPHRTQNWLDFLVISWSFGCLGLRVNMMMSTPHAMGWKKWIQAHWGAIYESFIYVIMIIGYILIFFSSFNCEERMSEDREAWEEWCHDSITSPPPGWHNSTYQIGDLLKVAKLPEDSLPKIGYSILGLAFTTNLLRVVVYWSYLSPWLGPVAISIKEVIRDVVKIIVFYVMFMVTFALSLHFILGISSLATNEPSEKNDSCPAGEAEEASDNEFRDLKTSFKNVYWSMFDPGHPSTVGCTQPGLPRYLGEFTWWIYNAINVIILLNLLIALMTNTVNEVSKNKTLEWKFSRTSMWLNYFVVGSYLPPPFNLLEILVKLPNRALCAVKCGNTDTHEEQEEGETIEQRYFALLLTLTERYIHMEEDSLDNDVTKEDLSNAKRDIISNFKSFGVTGVRKQFIY